MVSPSSPRGRRGPFYVPTSAYVLMQAVERLGGGLRQLSRLESLAHRKQIASVPLDRPVFITGCSARSRPPSRVSMLDHAELAHAPFQAQLEEYAGKLSRPSYYQPDLTSAELADIATCAGPTAARYGYDEVP